MMLGDKVSATEAERMGMLYKVFADDQFKESLQALALQVAAMPTYGLALTKQALNEAMNNTFEEQLLLEEKLQISAGSSNDYREGVTAFMEKRKPTFKGN